MLFKNNCFRLIHFSRLLLLKKMFIFDILYLYLYSSKHDKYEKDKYSLQHNRTRHVAVTEVNAVGHRLNLVRIIPVKIISNDDNVGEINP